MRVELVRHNKLKDVILHLFTTTEHSTKQCIIMSLYHKIHSLTGNKTIVVFGNSHAIFGHAGIAHLFRNISSSISTIFQFSCVPLPERQQQDRLSIVDYLHVNLALYLLIYIKF